MRRPRTRVWALLGALLLAGAVVAQAVAEQNRSTEGAGLSSNDAGQGGALALALWLEDLGYRVVRMAESAPGGDGVDVVFLLAPTRSIERAEAESLLGWLRRGGVLVYVPSPFSFASLLRGSPEPEPLERELGFRVAVGPGAEHAGPAIPFFTAPPAAQFWVQTLWSLELGHEAWVPLVGESGRVVAATRTVGDGRAYAVSAAALFSNEGLGRADNYAFVLNALRRHPSARLVGFDEYHHRPVEAPSLATAARGSPWGWAVAYAGLLSFGFLVWAGRRFGPAVVAESTMARSAGDYVAALGGLLQKARALGWVQREYAALARRRWGRMLGVRPDLAPADIGRMAADRRPVDGEAIAENLAALAGQRLDERSLLRRVRAMERLLHGFDRGEP